MDFLHCRRYTFRLHNVTLLFCTKHFNETVVGINNGKDDYLGGVLFCNEEMKSQIYLHRPMNLMRFHIKAKNSELYIDHAITYMSNNEKEKEDVGDVKKIVFAIKHGSKQNRRICLKIKNQYYTFSPDLDGYFSLYGDLTYKNPKTNELTFFAFYVISDSRISKDEILFGSTNNIKLSHILYSLTPNEQGAMDNV